ncbi:S1C family serine protease [Alicyclobacillus shizuokensis]|uniref:S1C family serine protease n=1 Tax=Alicyclobacillus shizuokensis TaxID=392014 RepID=UPI000B280009|nr:trypsin-like peptidase domain-containing protein [Alicyclobacillus shizuokensis]
MSGSWDGFDDWESPRRRRRWGWFAASLLAAYVVGVATAGFWIVSSRVGDGDGAAPSTQMGNQAGGSNGGTQYLPPEAGEANVVTRIYDNARDSVVTITSIQSKASKSQPQADVGTGFLIDEQGDFATNNHVVNGQKMVAVTIGKRTYKGVVIGTDALDDLAVVRVSGISGLRPLPLGSAENLQPGQLVVAIGNPFQLTSSVTAGIVSGLDRSMPTEDGHVLSGLVQTDAALNPGNSGGPLLNANGDVIGINTAIESPVEGSVGVGFAIPIDRLRQVLPRLLSGQPVQHPWLGISALDIDPTVQAQFHLPVATGVLVMQVTRGGPAAKAGIHGDTSANPSKKPKGDGDIIVSVNGKSVGSVADLTTAISQYKVGTKVNLGVIRGHRSLTVPVTLGTWPSSKQ